MKIIPQTYINRFGFPKSFLKEFRPAYINIVIPSFGEENLMDTLLSLDACDFNGEKAEVLVVLNHPEGDEKTRRMHIRQCEEMKDFFFRTCNIHFLLASLPAKHAGVGLARKVGMDEIIRHASEKDEDKWIICLDADCRVSRNYLTELFNLKNHARAENVTIAFEHNFRDEQIRNILKDGIIRYELFLRYYRQALRYTGHPHAYYTIGSCMGTRLRNYVRSGGMNKRKAGEDFYFLGKLFLHGHTYEITQAKVYPSCRISLRVPFGTGRAQFSYARNPSEEYPVYNFSIFREIKKWLQQVKRDAVGMESNVHPVLMEFLQKKNLQQIHHLARKHSASEETFFKRFFQEINLFFMLKCIHFMSEHPEGFNKVPILKATEELCNRRFDGVMEALNYLREKDEIRFGEF